MKFQQKVCLEGAAIGASIAIVGCKEEEEKKKQLPSHYTLTRLNEEYDNLYIGDQVRFAFDTTDFKLFNVKFFTPAVDDCAASDAESQPISLADAMWDQTMPGVAGDYKVCVQNPETDAWKEILPQEGSEMIRIYPAALHLRNDPAVISTRPVAHDWDIMAGAVELDQFLQLQPGSSCVSDCQDCATTSFELIAQGPAVETGFEVLPVAGEYILCYSQNGQTYHDMPDTTTVIVLPAVLEYEEPLPVTEANSTVGMTVIVGMVETGDSVALQTGDSCNPVCDIENGCYSADVTRSDASLNHVSVSFNEIPPEGNYTVCYRPKDQTTYYNMRYYDDPVLYSFVEVA